MPPPESFHFPLYSFSFVRNGQGEKERERKKKRFLAIFDGWFAYLTAENAKNSWKNRIVSCALCVLCG
jgi:hypothetical protein